MPGSNSTKQYRKRKTPSNSPFARGRTEKHSPPYEGGARGGFSVRVNAVVAKIPKGKTLTYKQVAALAGRPRAFRAVGNILNKNYDPTIPCHRVIRSDGKPGGYNRGKDKKIQLLRKEKFGLK